MIHATLYQSSTSARLHSLFGRDLQGIRIGLIRELDEDAGMHPEVKQAIHNAVEVLRQQGAEVRGLHATGGAGWAIFVGVADTEGAGARDDILRTRAAELDRASRTRLQAAALVPAKCITAPSKRVSSCASSSEALRQVDVLVSATAPAPPQAYGPHGALR